jgi:hypothetical protein
MARPRIDTLTPSTVEKDFAGDITIAGDHFSDPCQAKFDGTPVTTTFVSAQQITAAIDATITHAPATLAVRVVNNNGEISNDVDFEITGDPAFVESAIDPDAGFGILSSIQYTGTPLEKLFNLGTARPALVKDVEQNIGYSGTDLHAVITQFNDDSQIKVIITFGGNVAGLAAAKFSTKRFLCAIGNSTAEFFSGTAADLLRGGINFDTAARNADRFNYLNQELQIPASQICLLSNPNSAMASAEQDQWSIFQAGRIFVAHDLATIASTFNDFENDGTLTTMIVSADPFFQQHKQDLIIAANRSGKQVSYPLQAFANLGGTARPAPGRHWLHGPKLARAYFQLGRDAAVVLRDPNARFDLRVPPMLLNSNNDES